MKILPILMLIVVFSSAIGGSLADDEGAGDDDEVVISFEGVRMFVDELPDMPRIRGYRKKGGVPVPRTLRIGMYQKKWRFHRDLPLTRVFAYGTSRRTATVPGPTIETLQGVATHVAWRNRLPRRHILPTDPTILTASPPPTRRGVPTVVHLHGAITHPASDGNSNAWFTAGFRSTGPTWSQKTYTYPNVQEPGNLWYHDHAMGLTRVNLLSGLIGAYVIRNPEVERPFNLPSGPVFDRNLVVFDRSFRKDGSIYMNSTGNNPDIHPQWQPEYFGEAIIVNGKAWPVMRVQRRKYRFRILNASNARFFRFFFANDTRMSFTHVASDSVYLSSPVKTKKFLLAPSEIADVVVDFAETSDDEVILANDAPYPFPDGDGDPTNKRNGMVMKFSIEEKKINVADMSSVPINLMTTYPKPTEKEATKKRYIAMLEYENFSSKLPTHLYLNGKGYEDRATETPAVGTTEVWNVINLTEDNHPLHIHLGLFQVLEERSLDNVEHVTNCTKETNDPVKCDVEGAARKGQRSLPEAHESGWKNVYKMKPGTLTRILVRFALLRPVTNSTFDYPFDATSEPGYVYHCHILDHEDNEMMRPLKLTR